MDAALRATRHRAGGSLRRSLRLPPEAVAAALDRAGGGLQVGLSLNGPLLRVGLLTHGPGRRRRLVIVIHHLVVDGVSWRILLEDLWTAYEQLAGRSPRRVATEDHLVQSMGAAAPGASGVPRAR